MLGKNIFHKLVTSTTLAAVWCVYSMVAFAMPVDQTADSPVRRAFTKQIHQRTIASVQTWWQQQTFAGIGVAPPERGSDTEVLEYIRRYPGAIGYIRADAPVGSDIKVLDITP
jgi:ABC-type phosphate transport system substrate-binding protein